METGDGKVSDYSRLFLTWTLSSALWCTTQLCQSFKPNCYSPNYLLSYWLLTSLRPHGTNQLSQATAVQSPTGGSKVYIRILIFTVGLSMLRPACISWSHLVLTPVWLLAQYWKRYWYDCIWEYPHRQRPHLYTRLPLSDSGCDVSTHLLASDDITAIFCVDSDAFYSPDVLMQYN